ncbi:hypothetical protein ABT282_38525 [Streptomyces sp. NPDC000927]|uniref:hypothetical protein n=1 Tax=unclassified Streptomyces TaxID=2593676 RepID=UPI00332150F6
MVAVALAAVDVTAMVFMMNKDGFLHCRHLLAEARRHLAFVLRGRRREPGLDDDIVDAAVATHCLDISEPKTLRGHMPVYRFYTARWPLADPPTRRRPDAIPGTDHRPPAGPKDSDEPRLPLEPGEWDIPRAGYTPDQVAEVARFREELPRLSMAVSTHPYCESLGGLGLVEARMALKHVHEQPDET